jgi:hypothetical protein
MTVILATLVLAIVLGFLMGGRLSSLARLRIRWLPLAIAALALQLVPMPGRTWPLALLYLSYGLLTVFAIANAWARVPGSWLILLGVVLNLTVIGVNGGMPVTREALVRSDQMGTLQLLDEEGGAKHHLAGPTDRVVFLGDVVPVRPIRAVVSFGDLLLYAGVAWLVVGGMRGRGDDAGPIPLPAADKPFDPGAVSGVG